MSIKQHRRLSADALDRLRDVFPASLTSSCSRSTRRELRQIADDHFCAFSSSVGAGRA